MIKQIRTDIKTAMMEKDTIKRDVLKMVLNKANAIAKDKKIDEPSNEMVLDAIKKESKQLQDTIDILVKNKKEDSDLYKESVTKMDILKSYLPKQLSEEELTKEIKDFIEEYGDTLLFCAGKYNVSWRKVGYTLKGYKEYDYRQFIRKIQ